MSHLAIGDSEDEEEIIVKDVPSQRSTVSGCIAFAEEVLGAQPDGGNESCSLSSGELTRQIEVAQRGFFDSTEGAAKTMTTSSASKTGRRHTNEATLQPDETPSKAVKRTKTMITCNARGPSDELPSDTIRRDFENHNPNVMFKDTGSTIPFDSSSQERLVGKAVAELAAERCPGSSAKLLELDNDSSPFPWDKSAQTTQHSSKSNLSKESQPGAEDPPPHTSIPPIEDADELTQSAAAQHDMPTHEDNMDDGDGKPALTKKPLQAPSRSSPKVLIVNDELHSAHKPSNTQKPNRGRKRKLTAELDSEAPSSESLKYDDLTGLPKELYNPRPSRRRMTQLPDVSIDYSKAVEREIKRRKSMPDPQPAGDVAPPASASSPARPKKSVSAAETRAKESKLSKEAAEASSAESAPVNQSPATQASPSRPQPSPLTQNVLPKEASQVQLRSSASPIKMGPPDLPASATKVSKRSMRSHTTIFEDHVDPSQPRRSRKSPTLSQQQAARTSALASVQTSSTRNRKRRTIVQDDDEEEDELSKAAVEEPSTKRRAPARGPKVRKEVDTEATNDRNVDSVAAEDGDGEDHDVITRNSGRKGPEPKATQKAQSPGNACSGDDLLVNSTAKRGLDTVAKSAEKVVEDSDIEAEPDSEGNEEVTEPPRKKGRRRAGKPEVEVAVKDDEAESRPKAVLEPRDANIVVKSTEQSSKADTPAPAKPAPRQPEKQNVTPAPEAGPSPSTHSPIKKSAKTLYRVGLNKTQRIQPLLKMVKPAPARAREAGRVTTVISEAELEKKWAQTEDD